MVLPVFVLFTRATRGLGGLRGIGVNRQGIVLVDNFYLVFIGITDFDDLAFGSRTEGTLEVREFYDSDRRVGVPPHRRAIGSDVDHWGLKLHLDRRGFP